MKTNGIKNLLVGDFIFSFLLLFFTWNSALGAPFQNGDFGNGDFTNWNGDLVYTGQVNPNTDSHFSIVNVTGQPFTNTANVTNDDTDWIVTLFQDFTIDVLNGAGWSMDINFWIRWTPTDSTQDSISAELSNLSYTDSLSLLDNVPTNALLNGTWVTQDITSFARTWGGQDVELALTINDGDYLTPDSFLVDNISFNQHAPVPEPTTILLFGTGLAGFAITKKKRGFKRKESGDR